MSKTNRCGSDLSETLELVRLGHDGDGVTADGVFVPYTVPGDVVRAARSNSRARVESILAPGPWRTAPACRHFGACGGCALQHVAREPYLAWKRELVVTALRQRGFEDVAVDEMRAVPPGTRRRAVFKARKTGGAVALGFQERDSRTLVDLGECPVLVPALVRLIDPLKKALANILGEDDTAEVHATATDAGADLSLKWKRARSPEALMSMAQIARDLDLARLTWNGEPVSIARTPALRVGKFTVALPPEPFLQPTGEGERILQELVLEGVGPARCVADLFAGCGTFALMLADGRKVRAVEENGSMLEALAAATKGTKVETERRDLFRRPLSPPELAPFDAAVIDPPRPGAKAQAEMLAKSAVPRIVYVSCNPASFARDARILCDGGYVMRRVVPVDQFLWSAHVELAAVLERDARARLC